MTNSTSFSPDASYSFGSLPPLPSVTLPASLSAAALATFHNHMLEALASLETALSQHVTELTKFIQRQTAIDRAHARTLGGR